MTVNQSCQTSCFLVITCLSHPTTPALSVLWFLDCSTDKGPLNIRPVVVTNSPNFCQLFCITQLFGLSAAAVVLYMFVIVFKAGYVLKVALLGWHEVYTRFTKMSISLSGINMPPEGGSNISQSIQMNNSGLRSTKCYACLAVKSGLDRST